MSIRHGQLRRERVYRTEETLTHIHIQAKMYLPQSAAKCVELGRNTPNRVSPSKLYIYIYIHGYIFCVFESTYRGGLYLRMYVYIQVGYGYGTMAMSAAYNLTDETTTVIMGRRNTKLQMNLTAASPSTTCTNTRTNRECSFSFSIFFFFFAQIHTFDFLRRIFFFRYRIDASLGM